MLPSGSSLAVCRLGKQRTGEPQRLETELLASEI